MQSKDKATGLPMWAAEVIDGDPEARVKSVRVKVAAAGQPACPTPHAGMPFVPVEFAGLTITPYVNQAGRLAYSLKALGVRGAAPAQPRRMERRRRRERRHTTIAAARRASGRTPGLCSTDSGAG